MSNCIQHLKEIGQLLIDSTFATNEEEKEQIKQYLNQLKASKTKFERRLEKHDRKQLETKTKKQLIDMLIEYDIPALRANWDTAERNYKTCQQVNLQLQQKLDVYELNADLKDGNVLMEDLQQFLGGYEVFKDLRTQINTLQTELERIRSGEITHL